MTVGGTTSGYWAIGRKKTVIPPARTIKIDRTEAKIGRSIKKYENLIYRLSPANAAFQSPERWIRDSPALVQPDCFAWSCLLPGRLRSGDERYRRNRSYFLPRVRPEYLD